MRYLFVISCLTIAAVTAGAFADTHTADRAELLKGVSTVCRPGVPGPLCLTKQDAFAVVLGETGGVLHPVVAAARYYHGRVVVFGHGGMLSREAMDKHDTRRLLQNAARWVAKLPAESQTTADDSTGNTKPFRMLLHRADHLRTSFESLGAEVKTANGVHWYGQLENYDAVCIDSHHLDENGIAALQVFIRQGGGLLTSGLAWGWLQLNPGKTLHDHPGNKLLAEMGIRFADGYLNQTTPGGFTADQSSDMVNLAHAARALAFLAGPSTAHAAKQSENDRSAQQQAAGVVTSAINTLPFRDTSLLPMLRRLNSKHQAPQLPSEANPLCVEHGLQRVLLTWQLAKARQLTPHKIIAHPASADFPGSVPDGAARRTTSINLSLRTPGWQSTGLYAPPGQLVIVECDEQTAQDGLRIRIGCHSDRIWHKPNWKRAPEIARVFALDAARVQVASSFGGLLYVDVPEAQATSPVRIKFSDVVSSPLFVLGKTSDESWQQQLADSPAPWAELASEKIILSVPIAVAKTVDDPSALMQFWDHIADACSDLAGRDRHRARPERFVADRQISAGYMHAGYPIMTHLDAAPRMVSLAVLKRGEWGLFHELGHNHQSSDWTFAGTGEVTVNLFTLYIYDTLLNRYRESRPELFGEKRSAKIRKHLAAGAPFDQWKRDPFLALLMYMQIREAFGWEAYKMVFAEYAALSPQEKPRDDAEKRDQWLVRMSRQVGHNLGPFFSAWGVPTSDTARASIAHLPPWMPDDWPAD